MSDHESSSREVERLKERGGRSRAPANVALSPGGRSRAGLGAEMTRGLRSLHQRFCSGLAARLSAAVRTPVEIKLFSVSALSYQDFVGTLKSPTSLNVIRCETFDERMLLEISPSILLPIIDRLLGGGQEASPVVRRPLTEIEQRLAAHVTGLALAELRSAWEGPTPVELTVERVEMNPQLAAIAPAGETVVQLGFEIVIDDAHGAMQICLPAGVAHRLCPAAADTTAADRKSNSGLRSAENDSAGRGPIVSVVAHLAETTINASDLVGLRPGDMITTSHEVDSPLIVGVDGVPQFHARPGALKGHKAIQIEGLIEPLT